MEVEEGEGVETDQQMEDNEAVQQDDTKTHQNSKEEEKVPLKNEDSSVLYVPDGSSNSLENEKFDIEAALIGARRQEKYKNIAKKVGAVHNNHHHH
jgi:hypothetical protein